MIVITVFADDKVIQVWTQNGISKYVESYGVDDVFEGGDVLPGFKLAVKDIFPD